MFNFLGLRKDSKKSSDKELDGGFVIIGEIYIISIIVMVWCIKQFNKLTLHKFIVSVFWCHI